MITRDYTTQNIRNDVHPIEQSLQTNQYTWMRLGFWTLLRCACFCMACSRQGDVNMHLEREVGDKLADISVVLEGFDAKIITSFQPSMMDYWFLEIYFWKVLKFIKTLFGDWCCHSLVVFHGRGESWMATHQPFWPYCRCGGWSRGWRGIRLHPSMLSICLFNPLRCSNHLVR